MRLKIILQKYRMYGSWFKHFGIGDTLFMLRHERWRKADQIDTVKPSERELKKIKADSRRYFASFAVILPSEAEESEVLNGQCYSHYRCYRQKEGEDLTAAAQRCQEEYLLFVATGVTLSAAALWAFAKKIDETGGDLFYSDEILNGEKMYKPDFGIDTLGEQNYLGEVWCVRKSAWETAGEADRECAAFPAYAAALRFYRAGKKIVHIPKLLYRYSGASKENVCGRPLSQDSPEVLFYRAFMETMERRDDPPSDPMISILIPNKDHVALLDRCIRSIRSKSTYPYYEIVVIENNSQEAETFAYYEQLEKADRIRVIRCVTDWNYSYINNFGVKQMRGRYCLFLNNDTEVITEDWMERMLHFAARKDVGAVGAKLFYPDGTVQHGGVTVGVRGVAGHAFHGFPGNDAGYMSRLVTVQNLSAITAACMMVPREVFDEVGGFDEDYKVAFNDTDLCMRIRKKGYGIVFDPQVQLVHYESKSRGNDEQSPEKLKRFFGESMRFQKQWRRELTEGDPYYNPHLSLDDDSFSIVE